MENNGQYDELLIKYLANEVSAEESVFVENWVAANKENRAHFESLQQAWQLLATRQTLDYVLDDMNVDGKWKDFVQSMKSGESKVVDINTQDSFEDQNIEEGKSVKKRLIYRVLIATSVAASVLLVIGIGRKFFVSKQQEIPVVRNTENKVDSLSYAQWHEVNTTNREKRIQLPDGSLIVLAENSKISYRDPFTDKRNIELSGKAYFKVAKDKTRPFTVTSGEISTTAIGTEFTVTAYAGSNQIIVRLYEGKVVVKSVEKANQKLKSDVYLLPGQAFVYGGESMARVNTFELKNVDAPEEIMHKELLRDDPSLPESAEEPYFMFNNQSLDQVFDLLGKMYQVKIVYDKKDVQNLYFIRKYKSTDSLEGILKEIAKLNGLVVTRKDSVFVISK